MNFKYLLNIIVSLNFFLYIKSLDISTLSNYQNIKIIQLDGILEVDFNNKLIIGDITFIFKGLKNGTEIILDTNYLKINSIIESKTKKEIPYKFGKRIDYLGTPLIIEYNYSKDENISLNIKYSTTEKGNSAQFLSKEQTEGKKYPYLFTVSEMILGRELIPIQDTPAIKFYVNLGIKVIKPLIGMISGIFENVTDNKDGTQTFYYKQKIPIPSYLIALVAGNIKNKTISNIISVYSEPEMIDYVYNELIDMDKIMNISQNYMGEYKWEKYNILVLPKSFPISGMENPCLTFCSPCLINGDKSLIDIVIHELIHSWSGNLVTNENWSDFWLNEGITMFLQRKIVSLWKEDNNYTKIDAIIGLFYIDEYLNIFGENSTYTSLHPNLSNISPDDVFSDIPYEKGFNFIYYLETLIGEELMKNFFKMYFEFFKFQSIQYFDFKNYFIDFCKKNKISDEILNKIEWDNWIFSPGKCIIKNDYSNKYEEEVNYALKKFINEELDNELINIFNNWIHVSKTLFLISLDYRNIILTEKQHKFLTYDLNLKEKQNFLVTTNYLRLILSRTYEFLDGEMECLLKYLSSYGVYDYMEGIYGLFYKRDEIKSIETLNNLKSFYHILMIKTAEEEIEYEKNNFPLLKFNFNKNQCSFLGISDKFNINVSDYKESLGDLKFIDKIYLESENDKIKIECILNLENKYCEVKDNITNNGNYYLNIQKRIQSDNYAIPVQRSLYYIKIYIKKININETSTKNNYEIDYNIKESENIIINFISEPDENIRILNNNKEIKCILKGLNLECKINNDILSYDKNKPKEFKKYVLKLFDLCNEEKYKIIVNVKNSKEEKRSFIKDKYIFIIIGIILFIFIVFFIIIKVKKKRDNSNSSKILLVEEKK